MYKQKLVRSNHETDLDFASSLLGHILMIDNVILCVKKGKCYDSVDNIEYIANVSNDVRDVSFYPVSNMSFSRKQPLTIALLHLCYKL